MYHLLSYPEFVAIIAPGDADNETVLEDGTIVRTKRLDSDVLLTQAVEPEHKTDIVVDDYKEVLPGGVTHTVHTQRRRSLETIHLSLFRQDNEVQTKDEVQEVPGSLVEDVVETFEEPPRLVRDVEDVEQIMPDGSVLHQEVVHQKLVRKITTHQVSFDAEHSVLKEDSYAVDEVVPGTEYDYPAGDEYTDSEEEYSDEGCDLEITEDVKTADRVQGNQWW